MKRTAVANPKIAMQLVKFWCSWSNCGRIGYLLNQHLTKLTMAGTGACAQGASALRTPPSYQRASSLFIPCKQSVSNSGERLAHRSEHKGVVFKIKRRITPVYRAMVVRTDKD
jgi:hypothetical protein